MGSRVAARLPALYLFGLLLFLGVLSLVPKPGSTTDDPIEDGSTVAHVFLAMFGFACLVGGLIYWAGGCRRPNKSGRMREADLPSSPLVPVYFAAPLGLVATSYLLPGAIRKFVLYALVAANLVALGFAFYKVAQFERTYVPVDDGEDEDERIELTDAEEMQPVQDGRPGDEESLLGRPKVVT